MAKTRSLVAEQDMFDDTRAGLEEAGSEMGCKITIIPNKIVVPQKTFEPEQFERSGAPCCHSYQDYVATDNLLAGTLCVRSGASCSDS